MKKLIVFFVLCCGMFVVGGQKAHAQVVDRIPPGVMPQYIEDYLLSCNPNVHAAAQTGWVSLRNNPTVTVVDRPRGTSTLELQYNVAGIVCNASIMGGLTSTTNGIIASEPNNLGLVNQVATYSYGSRSGDYTVTSINFSYTGTFNESTDVNIAITEKRINVYNRSPLYRCVTNPGDRNLRNPNSPTEYDVCRSSATPVFSIRVNVPPPNIPNGTIDAASCRLWSGWTFDADRPNDSLAVHVYLDAPAGSAGAVFAGEFIANVPRSDVNAAFGIGGNHGYEITVPDSLRASGRTIYVYAIGIDSSGNRDGNNAYLGARTYDTSACPVAPSITCSISGASLTAGQSTSLSLSIVHRGPVLAPSVNYSGRVEIQNQPQETFNGTVGNGGSATIATASRGYLTPGTYTVQAIFDFTSSGGNGSFGCTNVITVTVPPPSIECSAFGGSIEVGGTLAATVAVRHLGPQFAPGVSYNATINITSQPSERVSGSVANGTASTVTGATRTYPTAGRYALTVSVSGTAGPHSVSTSCSGTITVSSRPYVRSYANDVFVGANFGAGCLSASSGTSTFNRGVSSSFAGSGSQLGVFANSPISGFRSASTRSDAASIPYALSFSNTSSVSPASNLFGGNYNGNHCMPDYWSASSGAIYTSTQTVDLSTLSSGSYFYRPSSTTLPVAVTGLLRPGVRVSLYIDGNATITGGPRVGYGDGPWGSLFDIPSLYVIARGDLNIANTVTTFDGHLIAQHPDANRGRITTCVSAATLVRFSDDAAFIANCRNRLRINGSFSARHINFLRAASSSRDAVAGETAATSNAAEVFVFSLETYLGPQPSGSRSTQTYDSITALPPVL